jgi:hypothetical protein
MRETLAAIKRHPEDLEARVEAIEALMLGRGMKAPEARRRLLRALVIADGKIEWSFDCAWAIAWKTIYWPHRTDERHAEIELVKFMRRALEQAWNGERTPLEHLRGAAEALSSARDDRGGDSLLVA